MVTQMLKNSVCKKHSTRQAHSTYIKLTNQVPKRSVGQIKNIQHVKKTINL